MKRFFFLIFFIFLFLQKAYPESLKPFIPSPTGAHLGEKLVPEHCDYAPVKEALSNFAKEFTSATVRLSDPYKIRSTSLQKIFPEWNFYTVSYIVSIGDLPSASTALLTLSVARSGQYLVILPHCGDNREFGILLSKQNISKINEEMAEEIWRSFCVLYGRKYVSCEIEYPDKNTLRLGISRKSCTIPTGDDDKAIIKQGVSYLELALGKERKVESAVFRMERTTTNEE